MKLPEAFIANTRALLGNEWEAFYQALQEPSPVSIRLNPAKTQAIPFEGTTPVPWTSNGYYLDSRPSFTFDPRFHGGAYYVQEASSMYLEKVIGEYLDNTIKVLDLCAAPGGKSTHISSMLPPDSLLVANEVIRPRANILTENLIKWGNPNTIVTNNDPAAFAALPGFFDIILADLPCSGEGMFRKDPAAIDEWSPDNVRLCAQRQRRIVADAWPALKEGGIFIYSTCTYNREENEENLDWILDEYGAEIAVEPTRFWPHRTKGEGFFIAALRKTNPERSISSNKKQSQKKKTEASKLLVSDWVINPDEFIISEDNNKIRAIPKVHYHDYQSLSRALRLVNAGIDLGEIKGKDIIPAHALAMSNLLNKEAFAQWEVDQATALQYLRNEALQRLPPALPKGFVLITYQNLPLGFVKNIGNRANNLYPSAWRIRKSFSISR